MKFLADMGVSITAVQALRTAAHDAVHLREEGLLAFPIPILSPKPPGSKGPRSHSIWISETFWPWREQPAQHHHFPSVYPFVDGRKIPAQGEVVKQGLLLLSLGLLLASLYCVAVGRLAVFS